MVPDSIVRGRRVLTPDGIRPAAVHVIGDKITAIVDHGSITPQTPLFDAGDDLVMPGIVDTHVHVNEPGRTEWEGYTTATRAAAAGGITTVIDMPLNCIPATTSVAALAEKRAAAEGLLAVDVGFWGGVIPGNRGELAEMVEAGVMGFKCFLVDSGVPEFPQALEADVRSALEVLRESGVPLLVHAELEGPIDAATATLEQAGADPHDYGTYLASRPPSAENEAIELMIGLSRELDARVHIVHLSSAEALPILERARREGLKISAETCPHYLSFAAEDIPSGATVYKCAPPIRESANRAALWDGLAAGTVDMIVSDHSPCLPAMKKAPPGHFMEAWGGVASLQLTLPIIWTEASARGQTVERVAEWMCRRPAALAGLAARKGEIAVGRDADFVVWNPEGSFEVTPEVIQHRHKITPYAGRTLKGIVRATILRGEVIYDGGELAATPRGRMLKR
jgi:allantoinase